MDRLSLLESYKADLELRGHAKSTLDGEIPRVRAYLTWLQNDPALTTRDDLAAYLKHLREEQKISSTKKTFSVLAVFHDWLVEENMASANPVRAFRKKYLQSRNKDSEERQIISVEDAARMVAATIDSRDKAILLVLLKTGIRRGELVSLDVADVDLESLSIRLKPTAKRSNRIVFFDHETAVALGRWLAARKRRAGSEPALFIGAGQSRLKSGGVQVVVLRAAMRVGLHTPGAPLEKRFGPHCCRHFATTHLLRSGMPREYVKWLRGDVVREAIDIYYHIDPDDVKKSYLSHVPQLGV